MQKFINTLRPVVEDFAGRHNLKLYDLSLCRESTGRVLRVTLDGSVTLDACANMSRLISAWLDEHEELLPYEKYTLEVTSPGGERSLRSAEEFLIHIGKPCQITTKTKDETGRKKYKGIIRQVVDGNVTIYTAEESKEFTLELKNIAKANLYIDLTEKVK